MNTEHEVRIAFENLANADLIVDAVYEGGKTNNISAEVLSKLLPKCGNSGGFRSATRSDPYGRKEKLPAYVVLYTSMEEIEWPDFLDVETGIFHYYGDNRHAGKLLHDTRGNQLLYRIFSMLHSGNLQDIPPILIFRKTGTSRDVRFLGLAVPGNPKLSDQSDLVAFWRTLGKVRFQNYEAYFTILDTGDKPIKKSG